MLRLERSEYERRCRLVEQAIASAGYDALVAYSVSNQPGAVAYLAGYEPSFGLGDVAFVVMRPGALGPTLITNAYWDDVHLHDWPGEIVVTKAYVRAVIAHLPESCKRVALVGYDFFPARFMRQLADARVGAAFEDATPLVQAIARLKSPAEIALIERAANAADAGARRFQESVRVGVSERHVQEEVDEAMIEAGAEGTAFRTFIMSGARIATGIGFAGERLVAPGDQVNVLCGARIGGYRVEVGRVAAVGDVSGRLRDVMESAALMHEATRERMGPGVPVGAVARAALECARRQGMQDYVWTAIDSPTDFGHGMGCWVSEPPVLTEQSEEVLEPGMVLSVEARLSLPGEGGAVITEMVAIEAGGARRLSRLPLRLSA